MLGRHSIEERKRALRLSKQVCGIIQMIMQNYGINEYDAIVDFYHSATYELLSDYNTKLWWHSTFPLSI
jgi:metal-responsive CopG/Arc/MetJ family transcriptional regulator